MYTNNSPWSILAIIGAITTASILLKLLSFLTFHFLPFSNSLKKYQRQPRAWAIVTGASAGIGFGNIQELASRGFGVIILAHKADEVNEAVSQIKAEFQTTAVESIVVDATKATYSDTEAALAPFMHLPITILVNNVGVQTSRRIFTTFESYQASDMNDSIMANNLFHCHITHILYPVLKRNGPSLIINTSSGAHVVGLPWLTVYSGTKAFAESWSKALAAEALESGHQIDVVAIRPGDVRSQGNIHGLPSNAPSSRDFAKMTLDRVGRAVSRGRAVFSPFWQHDIEIGLVQLLPERMIVQSGIANIRRRKELEEKAA